MKKRHRTQTATTQSKETSSLFFGNCPGGGGLKYILLANLYTILGSPGVKHSVSFHYALDGEKRNHRAR